jgi:uncharacterized protein (DUF608 family)
MARQRIRYCPFIHERPLDFAVVALQQTGRVTSTILVASSLLHALSNTNGVPLGGMGSGYVVYNARTGNFAASAKSAPFGFLDGNFNEYSSNQSASSGFHLYVAGQTAKLDATTANDDAKLPVYFADFGSVGAVAFKLTAFGPFIPGNDNALTAQLPLALFEVQATNSSSQAIETAVAMEFANAAGNRGLLTIGATGTALPIPGNAGITYGSQATQDNVCLLTGCDNAATIFSAGATTTFGASGVLSNSAGNAVAGKVVIPANGTVKFRFVLAWFRLDEANGSNPQKEYKQNYFYHNSYDNSQAIAQYGLTNFEKIRLGATSIVNRVTASNLPDWYEDRLLNNLYPMLHNAVCAKDGRVAFWEGKYAILGTLDQQEHAQPFYTFNWPDIQWRQFDYWARTQFQGANAGQIHHDHNQGPHAWSLDAHYMVKWDEWNHTDYQYCPDISNWSDLNIMFIFGCYELFIATGDQAKMVKMWPYLKNTGNRLITQCAKSPLYKHLPTTCKSTYDEEATTGVYNSSIATAAFSCMKEMARMMDEPAEAAKYDAQYTAARSEFAQYANTASFCQRDKITEGDVAGYSFARYLGLPAIMDSGLISTGLNRLDAYYSNISSLRGKIGYYHFYTYDHWGGAAIACGRTDDALKVHKWDYDYYYTQSPQYVHWQDIHETNTNYFSYMTAPAVWRSLFQISGYLMDNADQRLYIRSQLPNTVAGKLSKIPLLEPKGWGVLDYDENQKGTRFQDIAISFDNPVPVKELILKNNTGVAQPGVSVVNNGVPVSISSITASGSGFEKTISVIFATPIQAGQNLAIEVHNTQVGAIGVYNAPHQHESILTNRLVHNQPIRIVVGSAGRVRVDLTALNGKRIATVYSGQLNAGMHQLSWARANVSCGIYLLRMTTPSGALTTPIIVSR